jgi:hypothetical protein
MLFKSAAGAGTGAGAGAGAVAVAVAVVGIGCIMRLRPSKAPLRSCMAAIPSDGLFLFLTKEEEWPETSKEDCLRLEDRG